MPRVYGINMLAIFVLLGAPPGGELLAQGAKPAAQPTNATPAPVCPLMSVAEVRRITGLDDYAEPWEVGPGEGIAGGSACVYEGAASSLNEPPTIGFTLIQDKNWTQGRRKVRLPPACKHEQVKGLGDDAFFESCPNKSRGRSDPLYVKVGSKDLIIEMGVKEPATKASVRPTVIAFAKALAAKLQ